MKRTYLIWIVPLCLILIGSGTVSLAQVKVKEKAKAKVLTEVKESQGWLGISIQDLTDKLEKSMNLKSKEGVLVSDVSEDSPAEKAGLKEEDVIVEFAGKKVKDTEEFVKAVRATKPDTKVKIVYLRGDEKKTTEATVGRRKETAEALTVSPNVFAGPGMAWSVGEGRGVLGMQVSELNDQLAEYFGVPDGGVLVEEVKKGGAADKAGFKAGDVIVKIGRKNVDEVSDITRVLGAYDPGDTLTLDVVRKGQRMALSVVLEKGEEGNSLNMFMQHMPQMNIMRKRLAVPAPPAAPHIRIYKHDEGDDGEDLEIETPDLEELKEGMKDLQMNLGKQKIRIRVEAEAMKKQAEEMRRMAKDLAKEIQKNIRIKVQSGSGTEI